MRKILLLILIIALCNDCTSKKNSKIQLSDSGKKNQKILVSKDEKRSDDTLKSVETTDFSRIEKDSIVDNDSKLLYVLNVFNIKDTIVEFYGDLCYDVGFKLECFKDSKLLFSKIIKKKDFHQLYNSKVINLNKYILMSCSLSKFTRTPFYLAFLVTICKPASDDCFNYILKFDIEGNYTITPYIDENN